MRNRVQVEGHYWRGLKHLLHARNIPEKVSSVRLSGRARIKASDRLWPAFGAAVINDLHLKPAGAILHRICNAKRSKA